MRLHVVEKDMTKTLEEILARVRNWPAERQEEAARLLETMEQCGAGAYRLSDDERALVEAGLEQAKRGEFVPDAEMEAFWNRNRK